MKPNRTLSVEEKRATYQPGKCRWCKLDVKRLDSRRKTFCSEECVHEYKIRADFSYARKQVYKRDKGICQICGLNCSKFFRELERAMSAFPYKERDQRSKDFFLQKGVRYVKWSHRSSFFDIDHVTPVSKGGGSCGLDNLRLLCLPCHQDLTLDLQRERTKKNGKENKTSNRRSIIEGDHYEFGGEDPDPLGFLDSSIFLT